MKNDLVERLLPCPFCGAEAEAVSLFKTPPHGRTFVQCTACRVCGPPGGYAWATTAWNTRISSLPGVVEIAEEVERLRKENETLRWWAWNHIDALLLYAQENDSHTKEAVSFAQMIAPERKLRMAHLKGSGRHVAESLLRKEGGQ